MLACEVSAGGDVYARVGGDVEPREAGEEGNGGRGEVIQGDTFFGEIRPSEEHVLAEAGLDETEYFGFEVEGRVDLDEDGGGGLEEEKGGLEAVGGDEDGGGGEEGDDVAGGVVVGVGEGGDGPVDGAWGGIQGGGVGGWGGVWCVWVVRGGVDGTSGEGIWDKE